MSDMFLENDFCSWLFSCSDDLETWAILVILTDMRHLPATQQDAFFDDPCKIL